MLMMNPKKCQSCKKPVAGITTDGRDLYVKGERMPRELMKAWFPCPHCEGMVVWIREKEKINASN